MNKIHDLLVVIVAIVVGSIIYNGVTTFLKRELILSELISRQAPVVVGMRVINSYELGGKIYLKVVGTKMRECGPPVLTTGLYGNSLEKQLTSVEYLDDELEDGTILKPDSNAMEDGEQSFGWWRITPSPLGTPMSLYVVHDCDGVLVRTNIGFFTKEEYTKGYKINDY